MEHSTGPDILDFSLASRSTGGNHRRLLFAAVGLVLTAGLVLTVALLATPPGAAGTSRGPVAAAAPSASASPRRMRRGHRRSAEVLREHLPAARRVGDGRLLMPGKRTMPGCAASHLMEVVTAGEFPATATGTGNPATNQPIMAGCATAVDNFLGGDWRMSYAKPALLVPGSSAWASGSRWVACRSSCPVGHQRRLRHAAYRQPPRRYARQPAGGNHLHHVHVRHRQERDRQHPGRVRYPAHR